MEKDYVQILTNLNDTLSGLTEAMSDMMEDHIALPSAAVADSNFVDKTDELISTTIGVTVRYDSCLAIHTKFSGKHSNI